MEEVIDFLDLANYRDQRISGLPYGVRKVVELARALCAKPKLLLLDEPASGLNTEETEEVAFWIDDIKNDLGITVIMIEHDMSLVSAVSNRVLALNNGRMLALGTPGAGAVEPGRDRGLPGRRGAMSEPLLSVRNLETFYGPITAIRGVSFDVSPARSSPSWAPTAPARPRCSSRCAAPWSRRRERSPSPASRITGREPDWVARNGMAHVPEGREIFPFMTVKGNLMMGAYARKDKDGIERDIEMVYGYFPILRERATSAAGLPVGRPAADAGDRPRPDGAAEADAAGRAFARTVAAAD